MHKIIRHGAAQAGMLDIVRRPGFHRKIPARQLVLALRAGLDDGELSLNREVDGLMVADFEVQKRMVLDTAPVAAIEPV